MKNLICFPQAQVFLLLLAGWVGAPAPAASRNWNRDGSDNLWSNPNNWTPVGVPQNGETLYFLGDGSLTTFNIDTVNDLTGLMLGKLVFGDSITVPFVSPNFSISGHPLTVTNSMEVSVPSGGFDSRSVTISCDLTFTTVYAAGVVIDVSPGQSGRNVLNLPGAVTLDNIRLRAFSGGGSGDGAEINFSGPISGAGNIYANARSDSFIDFEGAAGNTFNGAMIVQGSGGGNVRFNKQTGLVVNDRLEILGGAVVNLARPEQIGDNATVAIADGSRWLLNGNTETIGSLFLTNVTADADPTVVDTGGAHLWVQGDITTFVQNDLVRPTIRGTLHLTGGNHDFTVGGSVHYGVDLRAEIVGEGGITKLGNAALLLDRSNSFYGLVVIRQGLVEARNADAFGWAVYSGVQLEGGSLALRNVAITQTEGLTVNHAASALLAYGTCSWAGAMILNQQLTVYGEDFYIRGRILGTGDLVLLGPAIELTGGLPNTFTGATIANCELLSLNKAPTGSAYALSGPLIIAQNSSSPVHVRWLNDYQLNRTTASVTLHPNALMDLNTHNDTIGSLVFNGGAVQNGGAATLSLFGTVTANDANVTAQINGGRLALASGQRHFSVEDGPIEPDLSITATIVGVGGITKFGSGTLLLNAPNSFAGPVGVLAGILHVQNDTSLGTTGAGTTVFEGATLQIEFVPGLADPLNIRGHGRGGSLGAINLLPGAGVQADIVLAAAASVRVDSSFGILSGIISGTGPFTKLGAGSLQLGGSSGGNNTYSGDTLANGGTLVLFKSPFAQAVPGDLVIGTGALSSPATVRLFNPDQISANITVNRGGLLDLFGFDEYSGDVTLNNGGDIQTGVGTLHLGPGVNLYVNPGNNGASSISGNLRVSGGCRFSVGLRSFPIFDPLPELDLQARLSDPFDSQSISKTGAGEMRLSGANNFRANLFIQGGRVTVAHDLGLGGASDQRDAFATYVTDSGSLALDGGVTINTEQLNLDSTNALVLQSLGGSNTWNGPISLFRHATITVVPPNGYLQILNTINGSGGITKLGPGILHFGGAPANTYAGLTTVAEGILEARRVNQISIPGDAIIGDDSTSTTTAAIRVQREQQFLRTANVTIRRSGLLGIVLTSAPTPNPTIRSVVGAGQIALANATTLTISNEHNFDFHGSISAPGYFYKRGPGTMTVWADSALFNTLVTVAGGSFTVHGSIPHCEVLVNTGGALRGSGTVAGATFYNGSLAAPEPGLQPTSGESLTIPYLNLVGGSMLQLDFFGPHATGGNDTIEVTSSTVSGVLSPSFRYPPRMGDVVTVIEKQSAGAVTGTFDGLPQNALFTSSGISTRISYTGGDGNDITLTVTNLPLGAGEARLRSGDPGGRLVPNDCSLLWLEVTNRSAGGLTGLHGVLRSLTAGLVVTMGESDYRNLAPGARGTNAHPFQLRTEPSFACGGGALFELTVTGSNVTPFSILYGLPGGSGYALSFDGRDDRVQAGTNAFSSITNNFTIELWVNPTGTRSETAEVDTGISDINQRFAVFPDHGDFSYGANHVCAGLSVGTNGISVYEHAVNYLPSLLVYSNSISGWTHVALVCVNRQPRLYVNGTLVRTGLTSTKTFVHPSANLGGSIHAPGYGPYQGQLDEVRIWNTALSQTQIQTNLTRSLTGAEPGLVVYFRCDNAAGRIVADEAPAGPNVPAALENGAMFVLSEGAPLTVPGGPNCNSGGGGCESCFTVTGQFTTNSPTTLHPLDFVGGPSLCFPPKRCLDTDGFTNNVAMPCITHFFTNSTTNELCVTAQLRIDCPGPVGVAAYLGTHNPFDPCARYLGDSGAPGTNAFSFKVPAGSNFVINVVARTTNTACGSHTLEVFGLPCPPPRLRIAKDAAPGKVLVQWSTAYPGWTLQHAGLVPGTFRDSAIVPVMVGGGYVQTNAATATTEFYRLRK